MNVILIAVIILGHRMHHISAGIAVRYRENIQIINILIVFFKTFISAQQHIFYLFAADNRLLFTCHIKSAPFFSAAAAQKGQ